MLLNGLFKNPIVAGYLSPLAQKAEYDYDPTRGYIIRWHYEGVSQEDMLSLQQQYVQNGIACTIVFEKGRAYLECVDSTQVYTFDSWSLGGEDEAVDVLLNSQVAYDLNSSNIDYSTGIAALQTHIQNQDSQADAFQDTILIPMIGTLTYYLYPYIIAGLTEFKNSADNDMGYVLRHKTNISNRSTVNISDFGVGMIYSTAQLLSEVTNDGLWNNPLSVSDAYRIANIMPPALPESIAPDWIIGWFKGRSQKDPAANNRIEVVQDYTFGTFERALYSQYGG